MKLHLDYIPTKKQAMFHGSNADELLYGGAAGGGKSKAIVMEALIDALEHPGVQSYLFRRSYPEIEDTLIREALTSIPEELGRYAAGKHDFLLHNGSELHFRSCHSLQDAARYQGVEMHRLYIDELTHFPQEVYDYLKTRVRVANMPNLRPRIRATSNPGGVGHGWVKARFIDGKEPFQIYEERVYSSVLHQEGITTLQYIPATLADNPHLGKEYAFQLEQKPEALRKALLLGDWNVFDGQVFTEFSTQCRADRRYTHVIPSFPIPDSWRRYRSFDWGYSRPFSVGYWAEDGDGRLYRYAEIYGSPKDPHTRLTKHPNTGMRLSPEQVASMIRRYEDRYEKGHRLIGIADPAIFDESRGSDGCVAKVFEKQGLFFERGDHQRIAGKLQLHNRLAFDKNGIPMLYVFDSCKDFIRTLPTLVYDSYDVEDINSGGEDHIYDETRYLCMLRPIRHTEAEREELLPEELELTFVREKPTQPPSWVADVGLSAKPSSIYIEGK